MDGVDEEGQALRQQQGLVCGLADKVTGHLLISFVGYTRQSQCMFAVTIKRLCYRSGEHKGERMAMWTVKQQNLSHNHRLEANPLLYPEHAHLHPGNIIAISDATKSRNRKGTYRQYLCAQDPKAHPLSESEYYNLTYKRHSTDKNTPVHTMQHIMKALIDAGFHIRRRWVETFEENVHIRRLDQICFVSDAQVAKAPRFCSGFVVELDATFNTNATKMSLAFTVGVDNHGKSFTAALSFIRAEAAEDYGFILTCLDELVFYGAIEHPKVLISD
jgi:hypothetical protein